MRSAGSSELPHNRPGVGVFERWTLGHIGAHSSAKWRQALSSGQAKRKRFGPRPVWYCVPAPFHRFYAPLEPFCRTSIKPALGIENAVSDVQVWLPCMRRVAQSLGVTTAGAHCFLEQERSGTARKSARFH